MPSPISLHLLVRALAGRVVRRPGRARRGWLLTAATVLVGMPWAVRHGTGDLQAVTATPTGAAVVRASAGRHLGFDTSIYPGDAALRRWREAGAPYEWVGFYLPAPCHRDASWSGKRATIEGLGFGTAVIYVGQQTWGRTPRPGSAANRRAERSGKACDADLVSGDRGRREGEDAARRTAAEGFAPGTIVFLDVERMERVPAAMRDHYRAWTRAVLADGRFVPGVYVHAHNAPTVHADVAAEFAAAGSPLEPPVWVASGRGFDPGKAPHDVGHRFAGVWQGILDTYESHGGVGLPIDVNVAAVPSPSAQYAAAVVATE